MKKQYLDKYGKTLAICDTVAYKNTFGVTATGTITKFFKNSDGTDLAALDCGTYSVNHRPTNLTRTEPGLFGTEVLLHAPPRGKAKGDYRNRKNPTP